jgi:hypothetical protein
MGFGWTKTQHEVHHTAKGIFVNQHKYINELVEMANLNQSKPANTPMEINLKLRKNDGDPIADPTLYRSLVGSLVYLTITRPDISFSVNIVSQFMNNPRHLHLVVVHRIIRYLKGTHERGIFSLQISLCNYQPILMLIGLAVQTHEDPPLGGVFS